MELTLFDDPDTFARAALPFLETNEAENNLPIGILAAVRAGQFADYPPLLATVEDEGQPVAIAIRTPPHNLLISFAAPRNAIQLLAARLWERGPDLPGVTADVDTAATFTEAWAALGGPRFEVARPERVYRLSTVRQPADVPGAPRLATAADFDLVVEWLRAFAIDTHEAGGGDPEGSAHRFIPAQPGIRALWLWEVDGHPVSMAGHSGLTPHGMRVGPVYTPPELRGHGYASASVATLSQRLLDEGRQFCFLFTELDNPTSNHIYQQIGYEPVCDYSEYRIPAAR